MTAEAHRQAAEDIEKTILPLQVASYAARVVIEGVGVLHFIGSPLATKRSIRTTRRATHAWVHYSGVKEREQSPNGGRTLIVFDRVDGTVGVLHLNGFNEHWI